MPGPIKLPPSIIGPTGTTGTAPTLQPTRPTGTAPSLPADRFGASSKFATQLSGRDAVRTPGQLSSDLGPVADANALPDRLNADLAIHLPELISLLSMTRQQKATRLVEFLVPYASKLSELAAGAALPAGLRVELEARLLARMSHAGLAQVVELTTGKSGLEVAKQLLSAATPEQAVALTQNMSFDAPTWASRPEAMLANEVKRGEPPLVAQPHLQPPNLDLHGKVEEPIKKDRSDKVLGRNMVWNVLHMFAGADGPVDERKKKDLLMATGGIIVLVITVALVILLALVLGK